MKERIAILKLLECGDLSVEEAEQILKEFDTKNQKSFCANCLYYHDEVDLNDKNDIALN